VSMILPGAFEKAGGVVDMLVIKNLTPSEIDESIREMAKELTIRKL